MEIENSTTVNCDNNKYNCILEYFSKNGLKLYDDLETKKNCNEIYEILINDIDILPNNTNDILLFFMGIKYHIKMDYDKMKIYYLMAIKLNNNVGAMHKLGIYYQNIEKNYEEMKKYYLMGIKHNNTGAMTNLGLYYKEIERNYEEMKKYYLMGIKHNSTSSMYNLGLYYLLIEKNYDKMKKYLLMNIEHNDPTGMLALSYYYGNNIVDLYEMLRNITNKNEILQRAINELENNTKIQKYNKLTQMESTCEIKQCVICLEYKRCTNMTENCKNHEVCIRCICNIDKCPYKCELN